MKNKEIEFKYFANKISVSDFKAFANASNPQKFKIISGYDHFYSNPNEDGSFYRHRVNTNENQLTFKRKTVKDNSFIRDEHNIDLPLTVSEEKIRDMCNIHGYVYNTSIFKNCFIYEYSYYILVFYVCYDINLNELGRFIEIEMREDNDWSSEKEAYESLKSLEKLFKPLGISATNRSSKSLFEMYRKDK